MEVSETKGECHFHGTLATDRAGLLYDSRFREAIRSTRQPLSEREMRTVEAMTALRLTARLTRQLMDRLADKHGLSQVPLPALFLLAVGPNLRLPLGAQAAHLDVLSTHVAGVTGHPGQ